MRATLTLAATLVAALLGGCTMPAVPTRPTLPPEPGAVTQQVFVRIDSTSPGAALVDVRERGGVVCVAPCLRVLTIEEKGEYEIHADRVLPSERVSLYSKEDAEAWLVHDGNDPSVLWAFRTLTASSAGLGLGLIVTASVLNADPDLRRDHEDVVLPLGLTGVALAVPVTILFGVLTAVQADSDVEFRDPALPGFRF